MKTLLEMNELNHIARRFENRFTETAEQSDDLKKLVVLLNAQPEYFDAKDFDIFSLRAIHDYINKSHDYYRTYWVFKIEGTLEQFKRNTNSPAARAVLMFFEYFKRELLHHMKLEDAVLLKFVENHLMGIKNVTLIQKMVINFLNSHSDNIILDLPRIFETFEKSDPSIVNNLSYSIFKNQLTHFQNDLYVHSLIEDEVYVPRVLDLIPSDLHFCDN